MPQVRKAFRLRNFIGGLNTAVDKKNCPLSDTPDCDNVVFGIDGTIHRRKGYANYQASWTGTTPVAFEYWTDGAFVVVGSDGEARKVTDSTVASITGLSGLNTSEIWSGYSMNGLFYMTNRVGGAFQVSGTVGTAITKGVGSSSAGDPPGTEASSNIHPAARYATVARDRVWAANTIESSLNFYSRVRFSEVGDPKSWAYNNYFDIAPDDFDQITGLSVVADRLVVFKRSSIYMIAGHTRDSFLTVPISQGTGGCPYPKTICQGDGLVYFFGHDGVKTFDGQKVRHISIKLDPIVGTPISACYANRKYYLSVDDSGTRRIYVYDADIQAWTRFSGIPAKRLVTDYRDFENEARVYASHDSQARLIRLESGTTDNGSAINAYWTSAWCDMDSPEIRKKTKRLYITHGGEQTNELHVALYRDWDDVNISSTVVATDPSPDDHGLKQSGAAGTVRAVRVRVQNYDLDPLNPPEYVAGGEMHIDTITFSYIPKRFK